jgi:DNA end-binding protein Ku
VPGLGPVERADAVKGYEYERGHYATIAPDDLQRLRLETADTIDVREFVDADGFPEVYVADPYHLVPDGGMAEQGYRVLLEALSHTGKIAVGQVVINTRDRAVVIRPHENGLLLNTLRLADEVRTAERFFAGTPEGAADPDELALMEQIITRRVRPFDPAEFVDHYRRHDSNEAADQIEKVVEPVVVHPMPGILERHHPGIGEVLDAAVVERVRGPAFLAVNQQGRAGDAAP